MPLRKLIRLHSTGTQTTIRLHSDGCWRVNIDLREANHPTQTIVGYLSPTLEKAKELADTEVSRYGHVCNGSCKEWQDA